MKKNYNDCLTRLLKDEGGYSNDPSDRGGATNFGITIADYRKYVKSNANPLDVKNMTVDQAKTIYKSKYWDALKGDSLPSGVDYTCFDYGVNSGLGRPRKALQKFKSLQGTKLIDAINDERTAFLQAIGVGKNAKFLKGWLARVNRVRNYSKVLATKKDVTTGPAVGAGTVAVGIGATSYFHTHQIAIIVGVIALAIVIGTIVHIYQNKGK